MAAAETNTETFQITLLGKCIHTNSVFCQQLLLLTACLLLKKLEHLQFKEVSSNNFYLYTS